MNNSNKWRPSADIKTLRDRAGLLRRIRDFFEDEQVLEVETPVLSHFSATDLQLGQWRTEQGLTLHTSPEFAMKRLLAAGAGDIFQICRVFRCDELGQRHNPEFTMVEWYRLGMDEFQLMLDVEKLVKRVTGQTSIDVRRMTYREAFLGIGLPDPHLATETSLKNEVTMRLNADASDWPRDTCLDALMSMVVEPSLPADKLCFIHQYPESQAALAQHIVVDEATVARRFELYWQGMELANGYFELTDFVEQKRRFQTEKDAKAMLGSNGHSLEFDHYFLQALESGMPSCSGVALGFDRLAMIALDKKAISEVIAFTFDRS